MADTSSHVNGPPDSALLSGRRAFVLLLFLASGASALVYEVVWTRSLSLVMGNTLSAVSTVLAVFMGGLAAGSYVLGRAATRRTPRSALSLYGWLEAGIGLYALLVPALGRLFIPALRLAYADGYYTFGYPLLRFLTSTIVLLPPTFAMGGTFPVLCHWFFGGRARIGRDAGALYAANTAGAVGGTLAAGFWLLPVHGMWRTTLAAAIVNWAIALSAIVLARRRTHPVQALPPEPVLPISGTLAGVNTDSSVRSVRRAAAWALGLSGFAALVYEVAWTRALAVILGPTVYAFSLMLGAFIAGLSLGSLIGSRLADRVRRPRLWFAAVEVAGAVGALGVLPAFGRLPIFIGQSVQAYARQFGRLQRFELETIFLLMLGPTLALGAAFPLAVRAYAGRNDEDGAQAVGAVYAANTIGAIAGSLVAGFVLLRALGIETSVNVAVVVAMLAALVMVIGDRRERVATSVTAGLVLGLAVALGLGHAPRWDRQLLGSGAYKYATYMRGDLDLETALLTGRLLYYKDGGSVTVTVREATGFRSLTVDGKVEASNSGDMLTQHLVADLPLLLAPTARRVCLIGLGSGVTLGAILQYPVEHADLVELSPEVVEASRFFQAENHGALADPRVRLILGDGRNHLLLGRAQYDVIVSEPSNPWMAGVANLFTREFFQAARARLAPGGILCQWAHTYSMDPTDLQSIIATFTEAFPNGSLWRINESDLVLIGTEHPLPLRGEAVAARLASPRIAAGLADVEVRDLFSVFSLYSMEGADLRRYTISAFFQTDDLPTLEYSGPRVLYAATTEMNNRALDEVQRRARRPDAVLAVERAAGPGEYLRRGRMRLKNGDYAEAISDFETALRTAPRQAEAISALATAGTEGNVPRRVAAFLVGLRGRYTADPDLRSELAMALATLRAAAGDLRGAVQEAQDAVAAAPDNARALERLCEVLVDVGDSARLAANAERLVRLEPASDAALSFLAVARWLAHRTPEATALAEQAVRLNPQNSRALNLLGIIEAAAGRKEQARLAYLQALSADPRSATTYANLGMLELDMGRTQDAIGHLSLALMGPRRSPAVLAGLARALERAGQKERAARIRARLASR